MVLALKPSWRGSCLAVLAAAVLAGCAQQDAAPAATEGAAVPISDPVVGFAAGASAGAEDVVVLPSTGQTARLRLVRAYAAASGRECREVLVRTEGSSQSRLLCGAGSGWREARPLIRDASLRP
jgi:type IV pilus biogenesis protein CpaD/CtpE